MSQIKHTLDSLLERLDEDFDINEEELKDYLKDQLKEKVDRCYYFLEHLESRAKMFQSLADQYKAKKLQTEGKIDRFREHLAFTMKAKGWQVLLGNAHKMQIVNQKRFLANCKPDEKIAAEHPEFIETQMLVTHKWRLEQLKAEYENAPELVKQFADYKEIEYVRLS